MVAIVWRWSYKRLGGALQMAIACAAVAKRELLRGNWCPRGQPQCKLGTPSCTGGCIRLLLVDRCAWMPRTTMFAICVYLCTIAHATLCTYWKSANPTWVLRVHLGVQAHVLRYSHVLPGRFTRQANAVLACAFVLLWCSARLRAGLYC